MFNKYKEMSKNNIPRNKIYINKSGLYEVLALSTKPLVKLFIDKYLRRLCLKLEKQENILSIRLK